MVYSGYTVPTCTVYLSRLQPAFVLGCVFLIARKVLLNINIGCRLLLVYLFDVYSEDC